MSRNLFPKKVYCEFYIAGFCLLLLAVIIHVFCTIVCYVQLKRLILLAEAEKSFPSSLNVVWSGWSHPIGEVIPLNMNALEASQVVAYRTGVRRDWVGVWHLYEVKCTQKNGIEIVFPAWGPIPLRSSNARPALAMAICGGVFILVGVILARRKS